MPKSEAYWIRHFRKQGFLNASLIAAGMDGAVYSLVPDEVIAKVWRHRNETQLVQLKAFYAELARLASHIQTPQITDVQVVDGTVVSIEKYLRGAPLHESLSKDASHPDPDAVAAIASVLTFLRSIPAADRFSGLTILDEPTPLWDGTGKWSEAILRTISKRLDRFRPQLQSRVRGLDATVAAIGRFLETRDGVAMSLVHGDVCPANVMVDRNARPVSIVDFGFLTSIGDPAFDVSIASAVYSMYGPHAGVIDDDVTRTLAETLGDDPRVVLAYRAVYALISSNAYSDDGSDGHFRWCIGMLDREDVRASLGLQG